MQPSRLCRLLLLIEVFPSTAPPPSSSLSSPSFSLLSSFCLEAFAFLCSLPDGWRVSRASAVVNAELKSDDSQTCIVLSEIPSSFALYCMSARRERCARLKETRHRRMCRACVFWPMSPYFRRSLQRQSASNNRDTRRCLCRQPPSAAIVSPSRGHLTCLLLKAQTPHRPP